MKILDGLFKLLDRGRTDLFLDGYTFAEHYFQRFGKNISRHNVEEMSKTMDESTDYVIKSMKHYFKNKKFFDYDF